MNQNYNNAVGNNADVDLGLRSFMLGTYRYMAMAMAVTAGVAYFGGQAIQANPQLMGILRNPILVIGFIFAIPFIFAGVGRKLPTMSIGGVQAFLFGFAAFMGIFMSAIAAFVDPMIIAKIFFMTVAMFGALSLFGYSTQRNLSTFVKYAFAAFLAYVGLGILGMFFPSLSPFAGGVFGTVVLIIALAAISLITAWETQMLKQVYYGNAGNPAMEGKLAAYGAASLLLAFINMFQILLSLFGRE
ncbi:Bax inhibitor-1 family protein [Fretibacter rubidus]|uniref:Bax inhibitor-1/YccA family protein n=1 Tax=Fretibacter rubidus TaxID=570162 RepID=UPI00352A7F39